MLLLKCRLIPNHILIFSLLIFLFLQELAFSEETEIIQYLNSEDTNVSATLIPDPAPGKIPTPSSEFVQFMVDDTPSSISLSSSGQNATVKKKLSSVSEGRHRASLTTLTPEKNIKDSKQLLFYYDNTPPILTRVYPKDTDVPTKISFFLVEFSDEGSGIPALLEEMDVSATINGAEADIATTDQNYQRFFVIYLPDEGRAEGISYSLRVMTRTEDFF